MIVTLLAIAVVTIWLALAIARDLFWLSPIEDKMPFAPPAHWPRVTAVIPARNEADVIGETIASVVRQYYPGAFNVVLVDDSSQDDTANIARQAAMDAAHPLEIIAAPALPTGWTGKLWAVSSGIAHTNSGTGVPNDAPDFYWLTDADIVHAPDTLRNLVSRAVATNCVLVSRMALLRCESLAERALVPAFVFFFQLLYPFRAVNNPRRRIAAAAGGCVLVSRSALAEAGGIGVIRRALIDDCALGAAMKGRGKIWLGLSRDTVSIRPYPRFGDIGTMIARSAYAQLGYKPALLVGTIVGLILTYLAAPLLALFGTGLERWAGVIGWLMMALLFQPMLHLYRRSPLWGLALPLIATFYGAATLWSAWQYHRGRGGQWKGRIQAALQ